MAKFTAVYDTDFDVPEQGERYMHCAKCVKEKPDTISPKEWARQQMSITPEGRFQLWCNRHDCNIALIRIEAKDEGDHGGSH